MTTLTVRQQQVLDAIREYHTAHGFCPSIRDVMRSLGFTSPNAVMNHLHTLRRKGCLTWTYGNARSLRVLVGNDRGIVIEAGLTTLTVRSSGEDHLSPDEAEALAARLLAVARQVRVLLPVPEPESAGEVLRVPTPAHVLEQMVRHAERVAREEPIFNGRRS